MSKIIKCYIDIGCTYEGFDTRENIYRDIENWNLKDAGIISMLKLEIDIEKRTKNEILFKQILGPMYKKFKCSIADYRIYTSCILKELKDVDLIVTFNGRDFDIPIIINNLNIPDKYKVRHLRYFTNRDRDLLDLCLLKKIPVKGGLKNIAGRLNIDINFTGEEICYLGALDPYVSKYNSCLITRKRRSQNDIKVLPLLEEKLGFLYEPRTFVDKFHKKWT